MGLAAPSQLNFDSLGVRCGQAASLHMTSPAKNSYSVERLRAASVFMMLHSAVPAIANLASVNPETLPHEIAHEATNLARVWHKFASDMSPREFFRICDEIWHCRNVDAFERYLSAMLFDVFTQRPETLRSSEQVRISDVLECGDMAEVVRKLAERKVHSLMYQNFDDLTAYLREKLGVPIGKDAALSATCEGIEVRNIIVHNGGIVNSVFLRRTERKDLANGALFPIDQDYVIESGRAARELVNKLDLAFVSHFSLSYPVPTKSEGGAA